MGACRSWQFFHPRFPVSIRDRLPSWPRGGNNGARVQIVGNSDAEQLLFASPMSGAGRDDDGSGAWAARWYGVGTVVGKEKCLEHARRLIVAGVAVMLPLEVLGSSGAVAHPLDPLSRSEIAT